MTMRTYCPIDNILGICTQSKIMLNWSSTNYTQGKFYFVPLQAENSLWKSILFWKHTKSWPDQNLTMCFKHQMISHIKWLEIALMNQSWATPSEIKFDCYGKEASIIVSPSNQRSYSIGEPHGLKYSDLKRKLSFNFDNVLTARREERRGESF